MLFLLFLILLGLGSFIFIQYRKHHKANKLYNQAKELEKKDTQNPYDLKKLQEALAVYQQCSKLVNHPEFIKAANQCQKKIDDRHRFQNLVSEGRKKAKSNCCREALHNFTQAKKLFVTKELEDEISKCQQSIEQQENYEQILEKSAQVARQGQFEAAINLLESALDEFSREDGQQLLTKLQRVIRAKDLYKLGLITEKKGEVRDATTNYKQALDLLPEFTECRIRLGLINIQHSPQQTITYLEEIEGEQAAYLRGFAYTQLGNWQQANREWRSISKASVEVQCHALKNLAERDRLLKIKEIELAVDGNNIEIAKTLSLEFINKFGSEPTIEKNLENYIQPLLERQIWKSQNWQQIASKTEQNWLEQQDINSLHNWAVATYYQAQTNSNKLADFIIAWSTALANIENNPTLQNVPWLGSNSIDIKDVSIKLKQELENAIDAVKDDNINEYLKLRDIYRREMVTLSLVKQNNCGVRIKQRLFILPGCYQRSCSYLPKISFPAKIWGALYTDWGIAVAACHEGDIARAIKIKPSKNPSSDVDNFANHFISYHEGCYYLQNLEWRKAIKPLQQAQSDIKAKSDWCKEIDRLCELQRKKINDFNEHLQFSKFWYELLNSQPARSYFAECKTRKVAEKLSNKAISHQQGLNELRDIQSIDKNNPVVLELIKTVQTVQESEKIDRLLQQGQFEEAVRAAKRSSNEDVRFRLAEFCLEVIFKQIQSGNLSYETLQGLNQIAQWAYELCPYEPVFQPIYRQLRQIGIRC